MDIKSSICLCVCVWACVFGVTNSGNVLMLCPLGSRSHASVFEAVAWPLTQSGHRVTIVSAWESSTLSGNITQVIPIKGYDYFRDFSPLDVRRTGGAGTLSRGYEYVAGKCHEVYQSREFMNLLNETFDVVLIDPFMNNCLQGFIYKLSAPFIWLSPMPGPSFIADTLGYRLTPSFVPEPYLPIRHDMSLLHRMMNTIVPPIVSFMMRGMMRGYERIYREYLGSDVPGIYELEANVSLMLMNSHWTLNFPRPLLPDTIEIGGIHCRDGKSLPTELDKFVSGADDGLILFSLGSIFKAKYMPEETRKIFIWVFSRLKQHVIWKWDGPLMTDLPSNVKLVKWLPQQDILAHPNTKLFITHGGLLSTQEALYHAVPMLGIPLFADQDLNMNDAQDLGIGLTWEILNMDEESLQAAVHRLLNDPMFKLKSQELSQLFRDQFETPSKRAVYWVEYVQRHRRTAHFHSVARNLGFITYHGLDVIVILALLGGVVALISLTLFRIMKRKIIQMAITAFCCTDYSAGKKIN